MQEYEISDAFPLPTGSRAGASKYPFDKLEVGQSFLVPQFSEACQMSPLATRHGRALGRKFTCRTVEGGVRIWREA